MELPNYNKFLSPNFIFEENETLVFDFNYVDFLPIAEITELFFYCCSNFNDLSSYEIRNPNQASSYLDRVNFFHSLNVIKNLRSAIQSDFTGNQDRLIELQIYTLRQNFHKDIEKILKMFSDIGLTNVEGSLLSASLNEIVENSFSHNLGQWNPSLGALTAFIMQRYPKTKELCLSFCDFGVGFLSTLKDNYPSLQNESQAIECALKKDTTSRNPKKGGNGLVFLQKNIFNGFRGDLLIRSTNTLVKVNKMETIEIVNHNLPFNSGVNIFFTIQYGN